MTNEQTKLSDRLVDMDPEIPVSRRQLDDRVERLFDRKLTVADWLRIGVMGIGGLAGAVVCGLLAASEPPETPLATRIILAVLALVGLFWAALSAIILRRGAINSAVHDAIAAKMGFIFSLAATLAIGVASLAGVGGTPTVGLVILPLVTLVLASVVLIGREIRQAELRLQQRLLEIEYRVARSMANVETNSIHSAEK